MKTVIWCASIGAALLLSGCFIPSLNPYYTARDVISDSRLAGNWVEQTTNAVASRWRFETQKDGSFALLVTDEPNKEGKFSAHLFKLKKYVFLDVIPTDCKFATNQADLVGEAMFPGHLLFQVEELEPDLKMRVMNIDWLEKYLAEHPKELSVREEGQGGGVLTASTRELQRFVLAHLRKNELFGEVGVLKREGAQPTRP